MPEFKHLSMIQKWRRDLFVAIGCGLTVALVTGLTQFFVGSVAGSEARYLLESMLPTTRFLCSAIMTAAATIMALMLTLLSLSLTVDGQFDEIHYRRIREVAFYAMLTLAFATITLVIHCIPLQKSDEIPYWFFPIGYYSLLIDAALLGGALVTVVILLYSTLSDMIQSLGIDACRNQRGENCEEA